MANVLFTRTDNPDNKAIVDGQVIFSTAGNGAIYLDNGTERLRLGEDVSKIDKDNVLSTIDECIASTNPKDVAGATVISQMSNGLSANGVEFIFDYRDGQYGYNTDPNRGADTFHPFKHSNIGEEKVVVATEVSGSGTITAEVISNICAENKISPQDITEANFIFETVGVESGGVIVSANGKTEGTITTAKHSCTYDPISCTLTYNTGVFKVNCGTVAHWHGSALWGSNFQISKNGTMVSVWESNDSTVQGDGSTKYGNINCSVQAGFTPIQNIYFVF